MATFTINVEELLVPPSIITSAGIRGSYSSLSGGQSTSGAQIVGNSGSTITNVDWTRLLGNSVLTDNGVTNTSGNTYNITFSNYIVGTYIFKIIVTDSNNLTTTFYQYISWDPDLDITNLRIEADYPNINAAEVIKLIGPITGDSSNETINLDFNLEMADSSGSESITFTGLNTPVTLTNSVTTASSTVSMVDLVSSSQKDVNYIINDDGGGVGILTITITGRSGNGVTSPTNNVIYIPIGVTQP